MTILIQDRNADLPPAELELARRRIQFALTRFADRLRRVRVRIVDINADRGGLDKRCHIELDLSPRGKLRVEATDLSAEAAVSLAADRAARRLKEEIERRRDLRRRSPGDDGPRRAAS